MIVIGGYDYSYNGTVPSVWSQAPWTNVIAIFDMTALQLTERFEESAESSTAPETVKQLYNHS